MSLVYQGLTLTICSLNVFLYRCFCPHPIVKEPTGVDRCVPTHTLFTHSLSLSLFLPNGSGTLTLGTGTVKLLPSPPARSRMMRSRLLREAVTMGRPP